MSREMSVRIVALIALVAGAALPAGLRGQCSTHWLPGEALAGANAGVNAVTLWDPDGAGPMPARLVVAGWFTVVGDVVANRIASMDLATGHWSPLGAGIDGTVYSLAALPNGDLVAGGIFTAAGGSPASNIARWSANAWSPLGAGTNSSVLALTTLPNGDLVAGGAFSTAGGVPANCIARWNGLTWSPMGSGMNAGVTALTTLPNGDLVAGGSFTTAGGVPANCIARWNGTWAPLGAGLSGVYASVKSLATRPNGDLVAGGTFSGAGSVSATNVAAWNGVAWSAMGGGVPGGGVYALTTLGNGDVVAGGGTSSSIVQRWNGSGWTPMGVIGPEVKALTTLPNGDPVAGCDGSGVWTTAPVVRWTGAAWLPVQASGLDNGVAALAVLPNGDLVAGGDFGHANGLLVNFLARWDGIAWSPFGAGPGIRVRALAVLANGNLVAGAWSVSQANFIAQWNGTAWSPLGAGMNGAVRALATLPNGDLVAGGDFTTAGGVLASASRIARWDGTAWSSLGAGVSYAATFPNPPPSASVYALATLPNGDLVVGGYFGLAGGLPASNIARWNGTGWSSLGDPGFIVTAVTAMPNGDVVAGGIGSSTSVVARWDGTSWSPLGSGMSNPISTSVSSLLAMPNGDVMAGGDFTAAGGVPANRLARWDGAAWSPLGGGSNAPVSALAALPNGDVVAGGVFTMVDGQPAAYVARLTTSCPASAVAAGAGCSGSAGPNLLTAQSLPWMGGAFRSRATGMPGNSLAVVVVGLPITATPLSAILPRGAAGCSLLTSPDLLDAALTGSGTLDLALPIPMSPTLAGFVVRQQVAPLEFDAGGNFSVLTSTNALSLTLGAF